MSSPTTIIFGFGEAGPLLQKSMTPSCRYVALPGQFTDLAKPNPALWNMVADEVRDRHEALVLWAQDALIPWDRLERARAVNHQPDFLWPMPLTIENGAIAPLDTDLFLAVGGFEMSLFSFRDLKAFHHAVTARALSKLLAVSDLNTMTLGDYLYQSWLNFESVRAPDAWLIHSDADPFRFSDALNVTLVNAGGKFMAQHRQWQMGRVALEARSRNTLAAADFARSNIDIMHSRMAGLMQRLPYHGFWPVKTRGDWLTLPSTGHHPVVASLIWRGAYHDKAREVWTALFAQGAYTHAVDTRDDGHVFGLLFAAQGHEATCLSPSLDSAARAQAAIEANDLKHITIKLDDTPIADNAIVVTNNDTHWGKADLFIPLEGDVSAFKNKTIPDGYTAIICAADRLHVEPVNDLNALDKASVLMLLRHDKAKQILGGGQ